MISVGGGIRRHCLLGDCFAYALAKSRNEELLFKGNGFGQTDVRVAM